MAALEVALNELSNQCTGSNVPQEVQRLFPNWDAELPATARLGAVQLRTACTGLEEAERVARREGRAADVAGYSFVRGALQAAVNIHDFFGVQSGSQGGVRPAPAPSGFEQCASGGEHERLVTRLLAEAPPAVHSTFPNFGAELHAAAGRPVAELRTAAARLEAAHADVACRLFTEEPELFPPLGGALVLDLEAQALAFCVKAMTALVHSKSAVAVADAVAGAVSSTREGGDAAAPAARAVRPVTSTRDAEIGGQGAGFFRFQSLSTPTLEKADPFNPCCPAPTTRDAGGIEDVARPRAGTWPLDASHAKLYVPRRATSPDTARQGDGEADGLSINAKLCGLPIKSNGMADFDMDDIEMEPAPTPAHFPLYTSVADLSETGGTTGGATTWASVDTGPGWS